MKRNLCWVKHDAGAGIRHGKLRDADDCTVRALATARNLAYMDAWQHLYAIQGETHAACFQLGEWLRRWPERFGVVETLSFPAQKRRARMTGVTFCTTYPQGRFVLNMAHHVAAVVDGQLFDTWNSSSRCVYGAWSLAEAHTLAQMVVVTKGGAR